MRLHSQFVLVAVIATVASCGRVTCPPGLVRNEAMQACVPPLECAEGTVANDATYTCDAVDAGTAVDGAAADTGPAELGPNKTNLGTSTASIGAAGSAGMMSADPCASAKPSAQLDGCCPVGANASTDADCMPVCGNGAIEPAETCDPTSNCPTAATCKSTNACLAPSISGDPNACTSKCDLVPVTACKNGDGCCPMGCNYGSDMDCSQSCGDGVVNTNETCEPSSTTQPCQASCDDKKACTTDVLTGSPQQCNVVCTNTPITAPMNGDHCCPDSANASNDNDCATRCGDGVVTGNEACDPMSTTACPSPTSCRSAGCMAASFSGDAASCTAKCDWSAITMPQSGDGCCPDGANASNDSDCATRCGDGVVTGNETCDPISTTVCPSPSSCRSSGCTNAIFSGDGCTAKCTMGQITQPISDDGCCPNGGNASTDSDCPTQCGDGVVTGGEACDPLSSTPCPSASTCRSYGCTGAVLSGDGCMARCTMGQITAPSPGDGCCPSGANASTDSDCPTQCGDGVVTGGETCDPVSSTPCPSASTCRSYGCTSAVLSGDGCTAKCEMHEGVVNQCGGCTTLANEYRSSCQVVTDTCSAQGTWECDGKDSLKCVSGGNGSGEICDGQDNDCDRLVDEGDDLSPGGACF